MRQVELGNTGIKVSRLVFGCWGITNDFQWKDRKEEESLGAIDAALELGVQFFDTAEMYADGDSEELLGRALKGRRDQAVIASKVRPENMHPEKVIEACENSLKRLQTDYLDLYQTHWFMDRDIPVEDSWAAMIQLKEQGKVRSIGVCNAGVQDLSTLDASEIPVSNQLPYNLLWRAIETAIVLASTERNMGILVYSPLMHGLLAGNYNSASDVPDPRARTRHFSDSRSLARHGEAGHEELTFKTLAAIQSIADDLGRPMADVALGWLDAQEGVTGIIAGARTRKQLERNIAGLEQSLPNDVIEKLNEATQELKNTLGPNPDMWQGDAGSRYY